MDVEVHVLWVRHRLTPPQIPTAAAAAAACCRLPPPATACHGHDASNLTQSPSVCTCHMSVTACACACARLCERICGSTKFCETPWALQTRLSCGEGFRKCIGEYQPDLVVSLHPLCQNLPLQVLKTLHKEGELPRVPFATVCTDLGGAHLSWFKKETDLVFIPSNAVRKVALRRGIKPSKIRQYGLPVRSDFWRASDPSARPSEAQYTEVSTAGLSISGLAFPSSFVSQAMRTHLVRCSSAVVWAARPAARQAHRACGGRRRRRGQPRVHRRRDCEHARGGSAPRHRAGRRALNKCPLP